MTAAADIAWAAGLFEGEGCFTIQRSPRKRANGESVVYKQPVARLHMTDKDVVERFAKIVGVGQFWEAGFRRGGLGKKLCYEWHVTTYDGFMTVWKMFTSQLSDRRNLRALEVLAEYNENQILLRGGSNVG